MVVLKTLAVMKPISEAEKGSSRLLDQSQVVDHGVDHGVEVGIPHHICRRRLGDNAHVNGEKDDLEQLLAPAITAENRETKLLGLDNFQSNDTYELVGWLNETLPIHDVFCERAAAQLRDMRQSSLTITARSHLKPRDLIEEQKRRGSISNACRRRGCLLFTIHPTIS